MFALQAYIGGGLIGVGCTDVMRDGERYVAAFVTIQYSSRGWELTYKVNLDATNPSPNSFQYLSHEFVQGRLDDLQTKEYLSRKFFEKFQRVQ